MWDQYHSVSTIAEALELLAEHRERTRIIAGGTDILIEMEQGKRPDVDILIDITRIKGLDSIDLHGDTISLGSLVTHNHVVGNELLRERALPLVQACWEVGAPQIRNRATIAGNIITGSSANDTIPPLMALDAEVTLASLEGERTISLKNFYTGLRQSVMRSDEMLTQISFPAMSTQEQGIFLKLGLRRAQAIAVVNVAIILQIKNDNIEKASIQLGSVAPTIFSPTVAENALIGKKLTSETISQIARLASSAPSPIDDVRSTAEYRSEMVKVLVARALRIWRVNNREITYPNNQQCYGGEIRRLSKKIYQNNSHIKKLAQLKQSLMAHNKQSSLDTKKLYYDGYVKMLVAQVPKKVVLKVSVELVPYFLMM